MNNSCPQEPLCGWEWYNKSKVKKYPEPSMTINYGKTKVTFTEENRKELPKVMKLIEDECKR